METKKRIVKLRERQLVNGKKSLYLNIMWDGRREKRLLNLYIIKPKNTIDREINSQTKSLAEDIRAFTQTDLQNRGWGKASTFKQKTNFIEYFKHCKNTKIGNTQLSWDNTLLQIEKHFKAETSLSDMDKKAVAGFKFYLENDAVKKNGNPISINSQALYFNTFRACINTAIADELIQVNPTKNVKPVRMEETHREYLTIEEVRKLVKTECRQLVVKNAFLFACLTGLRISDILKLKWSEVLEQGAGFKIDYRQKKTGNQEYLDISPQARSFLGEKGKPEQLVFLNMRNRAWFVDSLTTWCINSGITRTITFHCARHTFATLQLNNGTDIFTVSKLLGHKNVKTTQIYAKIMDEKKREAMNRIPDINL